MNVPGLGELDQKKTVLLIGGVVILGGIVYYRHKQNAGASTATTADINPATGYAFGSPEDVNALALQASAGISGGGGGGGGGGGIVDTNGTTVPNETTSFVDNAHWETAAVDYLSGIGESAIAVSSALGKYLAGEPVTPSERSYIDQSTAAKGQPPVAGANGYPPHIHMVTATPSPKPRALGTPHIRTLAHNRSLWRIGWGGVSGAFRYDIHQLTGGHAIATTRSTSFDLRRNGSYRIYAVPADGDKVHTHSAPSNIIHVTGVK